MLRGPARDCARGAFQGGWGLSARPVYFLGLWFPSCRPGLTKGSRPSVPNGLWQGSYLAGCTAGPRSGGFDEQAGAPVGASRAVFGCPTGEPLRVLRGIERAYGQDTTQLAGLHPLVLPRDVLLRMPPSSRPTAVGGPPASGLPPVYGLWLSTDDSPSPSTVATMYHHAGTSITPAMRAFCTRHFLLFFCHLGQDTLCIIHQQQH